MQFSTLGLLTTLFLASTAMACANGPYATGSFCDSSCDGAQRCGDNNWVVCLSPYSLLLIWSSYALLPNVGVNLSMDMSMG
jgi:hypothetical protein